MVKLVKCLIVFGILLFNLGLVNTGLVTGLVLSQTIDVNYPMIAMTNEEIYFNLTLNDFSEDSYDVKVEIFDVNDNSTKLSETWNGESFQTSYRYVNDLIDSSFSNEGMVKVKITTDSEGIGNVIFKLRNTNGKIFTFEGYELHIVSLDINTTQHLNETDPAYENEEDENNNDSVDCVLTWDEEDIINGEEFSIDVECSNLLNKDYDLKVYIYDDDKNSPISQTYINDKFLSSIYYIEEIIIGPDLDYATVDLRIKEGDIDFSGDAKIGVKIRESVSDKTVVDMHEDIEIIKAEEVEKDETEDNKQAGEIKSNPVKPDESKNDNIYDDYSENVVRLKTENIKTQKNKVYLSKDGIIKQYSIISFIVLIIVFIALLVYIKKKK